MDNTEPEVKDIKADDELTSPQTAPGLWAIPSLCQSSSDEQSWEGGIIGEEDYCCLFYDLYNKFNFNLQSYRANSALCCLEHKIMYIQGF